MKESISDKKYSLKQFCGNHNVVRYTTSGSVTNGIWILHEDYCSKALLKRADASAEKEIPKPDDSGIYPNITDAEGIAKMVEGDDGEHLYYIVWTDESKTKVGFKEKYVNYLARKFKDFAIRPVGVKKPSFLMSEGKIIGLLMPYRLPDPL